jgi:hypothetical protein
VGVVESDSACAIEFEKAVYLAAEDGAAEDGAAEDGAAEDIGLRRI